MSEPLNFISVSARVAYLATQTGQTSRATQAKAIGIPEPTLKQIIKRDTISVPVAQRIAKQLSIRPEWIIFGTGPVRPHDDKDTIPQGTRIEAPLLPPPEHDSRPDRGPVSRLIDADPKDFAFLPRMAATLSAGGGAYPTEEESGEVFAFRRVWIKAVASGLGNVFLMNVAPDIDPKDHFSWCVAALKHLIENAKKIEQNKTQFYDSNRAVPRLCKIVRVTMSLTAPYMMIKITPRY